MLADSGRRAVVGAVFGSEPGVQFLLEGHIWMQREGFAAFEFGYCHEDSLGGAPAAGSVISPMGDKHTYARRTCLRRHKLTYLLDWN